jgi:GTPase KRas protein
VGSSSLARQLVAHEFEEDYQVARDEGIYHTQVEIDQKSCRIQVFMGYKHLVSFSDNRTHHEGYLFVFSITDRPSFEATRKQIDETKDYSNLPILLVGNKCDLEHRRVVPAREGAELAESVGCQYLETSAKEGINVDACFFELVREVRRLKPENNVDDNGSKKQCSLS